MLSTILKAFTVADIRKKLAFTAALLVIYRLGAHVPVPSVNEEAIDSIQDQFSGAGVLNLLNTLNGGGLSQFALFALGIMPYITASIILQLLTVVVPSLEKLSEGGRGRPAAHHAVHALPHRRPRVRPGDRLRLPLPLLHAQSAGQPLIENFNVGTVFVIVMCLTAGCVLVMWLGELITQRGIGNGISLMIFASIVSRPAAGHQRLVDELRPGLRRDDALRRAGLHLRDRVRAGGPAAHPDPVRQARHRPPHVGRRADLPAAAREHGRRHPGHLRRVDHGLPADDRPAAHVRRRTTGFATFFAPNRWAYIVGETIFIILFTYFYTAVTFNPVDQADNLKKYGGFIPGVRPGRPTAEFLDRVLARLTFPGALYLAAVAALPTILINQTSANFYFGGTSLLIVIGVALDTMKQLEAQLMMRNYEGFLK